MNIKIRRNIGVKIEFKLCFFFSVHTNPSLCFAILWSLLVKSATKCAPGWGLQYVWRWFLLRFRMVLSHTQTTPEKKPNFFRSWTWPDPGLAIMYHAASPSRFESITNQSKIQVNVGYSYPIIVDNSENSQDVFVIVSQLVDHCFYLFIGGCEGEYSMLLTSWCGFFG